VLLTTNDLLDLGDLPAIVSAGFDELDWEQPDLGRSAIALDVDMRGLRAVAGAEAEPEAAFEVDRWHGGMVTMAA
jgi:hypothetical protein